MAGVVNPVRVSPSSIVSPVRCAEAFTHRTASLGASKHAFFFFLGWNSHSLEQWASAAGSDEVELEGEGVSLRDNSSMFRRSRSTQEKQKKKKKEKKFQNWRCSLIATEAIGIWNIWQHNHNLLLFVSVSLGVVRKRERSSQLRHIDENIPTTTHHLPCGDNVGNYTIQLREILWFLWSSVYGKATG